MPAMPASIVIELPPNRQDTGRLILRDSHGEVLFACTCLGLSVGHDLNPKKDPLRFRGNTPLGRFCSTFVSHLSRTQTGIGDLWIGLDPDDFHDDEASEAERNGRRGLGIHAGRGNGRLLPTHGCIRLRDDDMAALARIAGKARFTVEIRELAA